MMIREFLEGLNASGVKVWAEGDTLRCNAPKGVVTPELQFELKRRKPEILAFLRAGSTVNRCLVPIQPKGSRPPFFGIPGHNSDVFCYVPLSQHLGDDQPFYGLQAPGFNGEREPLENIPELAAHYVRELREFLPDGPYYLGGYCAGGTVAFELAQQLTALGAKVAFFGLFESPFPAVYLRHNKALVAARYLLDRIPHHARKFLQLDVKSGLSYLRDRVRGFTGEVAAAKREAAAVEQQNDFKAKVADATIKAVAAYRPVPFSGPINYFLASEESRRQNYGWQRKWQDVAGGSFQSYIGPDGCTGATMLREPWVEVFAEALRERIDEACLGQPEHTPA
jgi:thioesterase domain-containing protein